MTTRRMAILGVIQALSTLVALAAGSQQAAVPPIRQLGPIVARVTEPVKSISAVRVLSDGRVILDDPGDKQVLLFDSTLRHAQHVIDTLSTTARHYPQRTGALLAFAGDSSLYLDPIAYALLVIAPDGTIARIIAAPAYLVGNRDGPLSYAPGNRLLWGLWVTHTTVDTAGAGHVPAPPIPDTGMILRADLMTRHVDTVGFFGVPKAYPSVVAPDSTGFLWTTRTVNPVEVMDGWGLLPDGTIAIARAQDFHVDWILTNGARESTSKLPHTWIRLSDSAKAALVDSARAVYADPARQSHQSVSRNGISHSRTYTPNLPDPADLPDYRPPFADVQGGDADGNLWIREFQSGSNPGGPVFDVVSRSGVMIDRVQIPGGTTLLGWGAGVVYLSSREGDKASLMRARIH